MQRSGSRRGQTWPLENECCEGTARWSSRWFSKAVSTNKKMCLCQARGKKPNKPKHINHFHTCERSFKHAHCLRVTLKICIGSKQGEFKQYQADRQWALLSFKAITAATSQRGDWFFSSTNGWWIMPGGLANCDAGPDPGVLPWFSHFST